MFYAFSIDAQHSYFYIGVVSGEKAYSMAHWMTSDNDNSMVLQGIPIIAISASSAQGSDHVLASWRMGSLHLDAQVQPGWSWNQFTSSMLPPVANQITRSFTLTINTLPTYRCIGYGADAVPALRVEGPLIMGQVRALPANIVELDRLNLQAHPFNLRKLPPPPPSKRGGSPPPSAGSKAKRA